MYDFVIITNFYILAEAMRLISDTKKNDHFEPLNFIQVSIADQFDLLIKAGRDLLKIF